MAKAGVTEVLLDWPRLAICFLAAMALSSANYTINEWLDAPFDATHPTKHRRPAVCKEMSRTMVVVQYLLLTAIGLLLAWRLGSAFMLTAVLFSAFGIVYNVRPLRVKDHAFFDVLVESINNPLRFLFGWFAVTPDLAPPISILLAFWFGGAFLMTAKRVSEHRAIMDAGGASKLAAYRPSFASYTQSSLITSCLVYSQIFAFMLAIFLIKYRIEYLILVPLFVGLFASYMRIALMPDSAAARPEALMRHPTIIMGAGLTMVLLVVLSFVDLPWLALLTSVDLIQIHAVQ
jgi:4-hydroxybenzoate polyprenyltransferase